MNLLNIKSGGSELMVNFTDQILLLNEIIGKMSTEDQLSEVQRLLQPAGQLELSDMISSQFIEGELKGDEKEFNGMMNLLLLELQQPLGSIPTKLRGGGSSSEV